MIFAALYWTSSTFLREAAWGESLKFHFCWGLLYGKEHHHSQDGDGHKAYK